MESTAAAATFLTGTGKHGTQSMAQRRKHNAIAPKCPNNPPTTLRRSKNLEVSFGEKSPNANSEVSVCNMAADRLGTLTAAISTINKQQLNVKHKRMHLLHTHRQYGLQMGRVWVGANTQEVTLITVSCGWNRSQLRRLGRCRRTVVTRFLY